MRFAIATLTSLLAITPAAADQAFPAKLAGHAVLPASSFFDPPADAPADLAISGKFTAPDRKRLDTVGAVMGTSYISAKDAPRETGIKLPFKGQPLQGSVWIGDEFGPYLIRIDRSGKVAAVFETLVDGKPARSPDHYTVSTPAVPGAVAFNVRRSRGYEGMAASKDGRFLYPLLEGPLWDENKKAWETDGGREYLRILEFDVGQQKWTGRFWKYRLAANENNIGDFNMVDATTGLIIERDNGEGEAAQACPAMPRPDCFNVFAKFKRVYKIEMTDGNAGDFVRKIGHIDLLAIKDPDKVAKHGAKEGIFTFPLVTIEGVDVVDERHIVVGNDNNLPYSSGRTLGKQDDNELILVEVAEFLKAK
jgi:hypothetical protein